MKKPVDILRNFQIPFVEHHQSVSKSCVGIDCPFCDDQNKHLGIFKKHGNFSCFKCGKKGSLFQLIKTIKNISYSEYQRIAGIQEVGDSTEQTLKSIFNPKKEERRMENKASTLIPITCDGMPKNAEYLIDKFLIERDFTYKALIGYNCKYGTAGFQAYRLVIPIYDKNKNQVAQIGRDLTGVSKAKYKVDPPGFELSKYLYWAGCGLPILVEGVFDAWAIAEYGEMGIATFGSNISDSQISQLVEFDKLIYMPDADVPAKKVLANADKLNSIIHDVIICQCEKGDPCSMNSVELHKLIGGKL